ncbi:23S rRNA (guanosine(2251)-2'-O)-methyltransferase RlmB [Thalassobaculum sp. OXR-137]|uniref:23S rRNA (guanosine(2251)-2'-O)-methyltransferase RlmB n=1 Tax=Thalassobaculum sp. OXR-137 TaxID=3100173 RepID=UPI002AC981C6|nr:23S rRNA (guanosine(2251)-2'-O)-methyltransferase RlmB [Thalassobaculum sp. OXR-137]WPZ34454.1 23S rRNA (guanosine(2251)-2'-O)-methyltransferase RlmB [Thalassobaculum sp. OXR-137]
MAKRKYGGRPSRAAKSPAPGRERSGGGQTLPGRESDRTAFDPTLLFGRHAVAAALANPRRHVRALMCSVEAAADLAETLAALPEARCGALPDPRTVTAEEIATLVGEGAVHQGLIARVDPLPDTALEDVLDAAGPQSLLMVLDQVTDPHNLGAVLRSAAAFGADAVVVQDRHTPQITAVVAKTASGALDVTPLVRVINLARALRTIQEAGFWCVGLAEEGPVALDSLDLSGRAALVMGAEGDGLRRLTRETCDQLVHLPTKAPIRSLNVSAAAAIALHHAAVAPGRKAG